MKKYYAIGFGLMAVLAVVFLLPKSIQERSGGGFDVVKKTWKDNFLPTELKRPGKVNWNITEEVSHQVSEIKLSQPENQQEKVAKLLAIKGIKLSDINKDEGNLVFYYRNNNTGYWNRQLGLVQVKENILSKQQIISNNKLSTTDLEKIIEDRLSLIDSKKIRWSNISYKKMVPPRLVTTTENESDLVELEGNWLIDDKKVVSFYGDTIKATITKGGKLTKLEVYLIPEETTGDKKTTINRDVLIKTNLDDIGIVNFEGGENYELSADSINIENVTVTEAELVYVYDGRRNKISPYFWLSGTSIAMGPVKVEMLTSAERE